MNAVLLALVDWLTGCWVACPECTWAQIAASVVSCVLRAIILVGVLVAIAKLVPIG